MPYLSCSICSKDFYRKPSHIRKENYCSVNCLGKAHRKGSILSCSICGTKIYRRLLHQKKNQTGKFFCTQKCATIWRSEKFREKGHGNWKGGQYSYKEILKRIKIVQTCLLCKKDDKRILVVHHIDKNRMNNVAKNLAWLCHNCHHLVHNYKKEEDLFNFLQGQNEKN